MIDAIWVGGIGLLAAAAGYVHTYLGLAVVSVVIMMMIPIWGLSAGNRTVLLMLGIPVVLRFCGGRYLRRRLEKV